MTREQFVAWAAGFFDGEGHVSLRATDHVTWQNVNPRISVSQNRVQPLLMFQKVWGGKIKCVGSSGRCHEWQITRREDIEKFLAEVRPFVMEKATQLAVMAEYIALGSVKDSPARLKLVDKMLQVRKEVG
jgi:hypothetical protein